MDFSKLQMRYVDGHEAGVHCTKKLGGGVMMWTMQKKEKRKAWKQLKNGGTKEEYLNAKKAAKNRIFE